MVEPARPSDAVNSRAERIARIAMDFLHTLSRQGISQRNLRQALVSSFGAELINRIGASITSKTQASNVAGPSTNGDHAIVVSGDLI